MWRGNVVLRVGSTHAGKGGGFERCQHRCDLLTLLVLTFDLHHVQHVFGGGVDAGLRGESRGLGEAVALLMASMELHL